ncbi:hypothetical protein [Luteimonas saliphila]|uniref:hypothetical protein n=1 Tax=Luteimonas saliphila TaxID=2804919 RepID=UPI00192D3307|nr:hypothetical protein [Luteimonas saliphila]
MSAKIAGYEVFVLFWAALFAATGVSLGWLAAVAVWATALSGSFVAIWATGAIIYEDWWPFRHL